MHSVTRPDVLREVNAVLEKEGLPLWTSLSRIGKHRSREHEITGVSHVIVDLKAYYVIIVFDVIRPDGSVGKYGVRSTTRIPTCVVTLINDKVLLVKQHRLTTGTWTLEMPRGWIEPERARNTPGGAGRVLLDREIGSELTARLDIPSPILLGSVWEDTGSRLDQVQIYLSQFRSDEDLPRRAEHIKHALYTWNQVDELLDKEILNDQTSLAALLKTERFLRKPRSA